MRKSILFVCTGNTCHRPMGEAFARAEASLRGLDLEISSAGISAMGDLTTQASIDAARDLGVDVPRRQSTQVNIAEAKNKTWVLTLASHHRATLARDGVRATTLIEAAYGKECDIADPMTARDSPAAYSRAGSEIQDAVRTFFDREFGPTT